VCVCVVSEKCGVCVEREREKERERKRAREREGQRESVCILSVVNVFYIQCVCVIVDSNRYMQCSSLSTSI
jgi:hypothetical protein